MSWRRTWMDLFRRRRTFPKDSQPAKSDEMPFLDLAAIDEKSLADAAERSLADLRREGKLPPPAKYDLKKEEENERIQRKLFGEPVPRGK